MTSGMPAPYAQLLAPSLSTLGPSAADQRLIGVSLLTRTEGVTDDIRVGLGIDGCALWVLRGGRLRLLDSAGDTSRLALHAEHSDMDDQAFLSGTNTSLFNPIVHNGEVVGRLGMWQASGLPITRAEWTTRVETLCARLAHEVIFLISHDRLRVEHERLHQTAMIDEVSGAWTRTAFERNLTSSIAASTRRGEPLALLLFDLIGLGGINDRLGHAAGDAALAHLTTLLRANVRSTDELGRVGGSEIALLLTNAPDRPAVCVAEKLVRRLSERPLQIGDTELTLRVRVAVTSLAPTERTGDDALARLAWTVANADDDGVRFVAADAATQPTSRTDAGLSTGTVLGGMYRLLHEVSRGATGVVYRGVDMVLDRQVAIKVLRSDLAQSPAKVAQFRREAAALAALRHPNLVGVHTAGVEQDRIYFVMELIEGTSLWSPQASAGAPRRLDDTSTIVQQIAEALEAMHGAGLIHRDVKPENVVLDRNSGRAVLVDVGTAKRYGEAGSGAGTPGFSAPESFSGEPEVFATDVYGLAATTYMLLTGTPPFGYGEPYMLLARQVDGPPDPPSQHQPGLPPAVDDVLRRGLASSPTARYRSPRQFADALTAALAPMLAEHVPIRVSVRQASPLGATMSGAHALPTSDGPCLLRGAAVRIAVRAIGVRRGEWFLRRMAEDDGDVARLLRPDIAPMSWHPAATLVGMLASAGGSAFELGKTVGMGMVVATFAQVWGADPAVASPREVLAAAPSYWDQYVTGMEVEVLEVEDDRVDLALRGPTDQAALRGIVVGALQRVAELGGADEVVVTTREVDDQRWVLSVSWSALTAA
jgi:diguanylate cyclase (GGDEF)-like protein